MKMEELGKTQSISNSEMGMFYAFMGKYEMAAEYFEKSIEKREALMLFAKYGIMSFDETLLIVPQIQTVLEKIEAFKRKIN